MKFILVSASRRRIEYLKDFGFIFEVKKVRLNEVIVEGNAVSTAIKNAYLKAYSAHKSAPLLPVVGMDTVVEVDGKILGKPKNRKENLEMLHMLKGKAHRVITGIACLKKDFIMIDYETSIVEFRSDIEEDFFLRYVQTGEGLDKAGGYAVQGLASAFINKITGPVDNVIGIPVLKIYKIINAICEV